MSDQGIAAADAAAHGSSGRADKAAHPRPLSILITNIIMTGRTGTEIAAAELSLALRARGHRVAIYSPALGPAASELMARGIPVTDQIERIAFRPDILHGSHNVALAVALVRFPETPAIFVCHDTSLSFDAPLLCQQIGAYVAVDAACVERLVVAGVDENRVWTIPNGIDVGRFPLRAQWADTPRQALAITKFKAPYLDAIREVCRVDGLALEVIGPGIGRTVGNLADFCAAADIVFAASRSAMEAAASGAAVVICDERGFGGLLMPVDVEQWPDTLLSRRQWRGPVTVAALRAAIAAYRADDARRCAALLRERVALERIAGEYEDAYRAAMAAAPRRHGERPGDGGALAAFVARLLPQFGAASAYQRCIEAAERRGADFDRWSAMAAADPDLVEIAFTKDGPGRFLLDGGWHDEEDWGVWSRDLCAQLRLPRALARRWAGELAIACFHYIPADADEVRDVEVLVDGEPVDVWRFRHSDFITLGTTPRRLCVPAERLAGEGFLRVTFRMASVLSPFEAGASPDTRQLGLGIRHATAFPEILSRIGGHP